MALSSSEKKALNAAIAKLLKLVGLRDGSVPDLGDLIGRDVRLDSWNVKDDGSLEIDNSLLLNGPNDFKTSSDMQSLHLFGTDVVMGVNGLSSNRCNGCLVFISADNCVEKAHSGQLDSSRVAGFLINQSTLITSGVVEVECSEDSIKPEPGEYVYLSSDPGKVTNEDSKHSGNYLTPVGIVLSNSKFDASKIVKIILQHHTPIANS